MKRLALGFAVVMLTANAFAQNVGINGTGAAGNADAMLDVNATDKGLLIPRVALSATNSNAPIGAGITTSLLVYNTATSGASPNQVTPGYYYWGGAKWVRFTDNDFFGYSESTTLYGGGATLRQSVTVTVEAGDKVYLRGEFDFAKDFFQSWVAAELFRGATNIHECAVLASGNSDNSIHIQWVDQPPAGTYTYRLRNTQGAGGFGFIYGSSLNATVIKQ